MHPIIATRWAGHLQSKNLEMVIVANEGYLTNRVNFSCRIPLCARNRDPPVDIIAKLKAFASLTGPPDDENNPRAPKASSGDEINSCDDEASLGDEISPGTDKAPLLQRLGVDFARGHVQASGGIVGTEEFEELVRNMQIGVKLPKTAGQESSAAKGKKSGIDSSQKNNLMSYFSKKAATSDIQS